MNSTPTTHTFRQVRLVIAALSAVLLVAVTAQPSSAASPDKQPLHDYATEQPITATYSMLDRSDEAIASRIRTAATPGHAVTLWYVIFNTPALCKDVDPDTDELIPGECSADDIFLDPAAGGAGGFNATQIDAARISVVYGGDGGVVNPGGRLALDGGLTESEVPTGTNQVVIGSEGALVPLSPVSGLEHAQTAEVHIVLQDHGLAHDNPDLLAAQVSSFNGECNPACVDVQFAIHK